VSTPFGDSEGLSLMLAQGRAEASARALLAIRALETADRVDHSGHIGADGEPCGEVRTWQSRLGRDLAVILDQADVPELLPAVLS
jgi:hypothetical protein